MIHDAAQTTIGDENVSGRYQSMNLLVIHFRNISATEVKIKRMKLEKATGVNGITAES